MMKYMVVPLVTLVVLVPAFSLWLPERLGS